MFIYFFLAEGVLRSLHFEGGWTFEIFFFINLFNERLLTFTFLLFLGSAAAARLQFEGKPSKYFFIINSFNER